MKANQTKSLLSRIFGRGNAVNKPQQTNGHTPKSDNAKRNAEFWDMVHVNLGHAHMAAGDALMRPCAHLQAAQCEAFEKALNFCGLIIDEKELRKAQKKYGTENFFEIFKQLPAIGL